MSNEVLQVTLIKGVGLKVGDANGKSDPFCTIYFEGTPKESYVSSEVILKTLDPVWNFSFNLPWNPNKARGVPDAAERLVIECWDKDAFGQDSLGAVVIPARQLENGEHAFDLKPKDAKDQGIVGQIFVSFVLPPSAANMNRQPPPVVERKDRLQNNPYLAQIAQKFGISAKRFTLSLYIFLFLSVFFGFGSKALSSVVGVLYPMYRSFKAVKSDDKEDDSQWLTYWVVYGFISMTESFTDFFLFWIPFYYLLKMVIFVWLMHPATMGAQIVYNQFVRPFFLKIEN